MRDSGILGKYKEKQSWSSVLGFTFNGKIYCYGCGFRFLGLRDAAGEHPVGIFGKDGNKMTEQPYCSECGDPLEVHGWGWLVKKTP